MAIAIDGNSEGLADKRFFFDIYEELWQAIKQKLDRDFIDTIWLTEDQRVDRNESWFNIILKPKTT